MDVRFTSEDVKPAFDRRVRKTLISKLRVFSLRKEKKPLRTNEFTSV